MKVDFERFGYNNFLQDFIWMKLSIKFLLLFHQTSIAILTIPFLNLKSFVIVETFNVDFHNKFTYLWTVSLFFFIYIYIYIYMCVCVCVCVFK